MYKTKEARQAYWKRYYADPTNRAKHIKRNRLSEKSWIEITRRWVNAYKVLVGCADCSYNTNPLALDFDHKNPRQKVNIIPALIKNNSIFALIEEIFKCDIRCANCHRIKHHSK